MKNNLTIFNEQNANGIYSEDELNVMNYELAEELDDLGFNEIDDVDENILSYVCEKIIDRH